MICGRTLIHSPFALVCAIVFVARGAKAQEIELPMPRGDLPLLSYVLPPVGSTEGDLAALIAPLERVSEPSTVSWAEAIPPIDTEPAARDEGRGLAGTGFVGALAWYPGALVGFLTLAKPEQGHPPLMVGAVAGGGAATGMVVGLLVALRGHCDPLRVLGAAVLGGEIGSFAGAAATGGFGRLSGHGMGLAAATVVMPLASALAAVAFVRGCR